MKTNFVADAELEKYRTNDPFKKTSAFILFMKDVCDFEMYPTQIMDAEQNFLHPYTMNVKPPRGGKTRGTEAIDLFECVTNPNEDLRIYAPNFKMGKEAMAYPYDWSFNPWFNGCGELKMKSNR